jgi:hypothetical protein
MQFVFTFVGAIWLVSICDEFARCAQDSTCTATMPCIMHGQRVWQRAERGGHGGHSAGAGMVAGAESREGTKHGTKAKKAEAKKKRKTKNAKD